MQRFYIGVKAVIEKDGKYLILKHTKGHWDMPGGRINEGESIEQALQREVSEELPGCSVSDHEELLNAYRVPINPFGDIGLMLLFYSVQLSIPENLVLGDEHSEYQWVTIEELQQIPSEALQDLANRLVR